MMRKRKIIITLTVGSIVITMLLATRHRSSERLNGEAESKARMVITLLEEHLEIHGQYPESLSELRGHNIEIPLEYSFFGSLPLHYHSSDSGFLIGYYRAPMGPSHEYHSKTRNWTYSE